MTTTTEITNTQDVIDSRDVLERIEELEEAQTEEGQLPDIEVSELVALQSLAVDGEQSPDWPYGETLIRDSYFRKYAMELAEDIGAINRNVNWPLNYIDWAAAADALKMDYFEVDFGGVTYYIRA